MPDNTPTSPEIPAELAIAMRTSAAVPTVKPWTFDVVPRRMTLEDVRRGAEAIANEKPRDPVVILSRRQYKIAQQLVAGGRDPLSAALEAQCR